MSEIYLAYKQTATCPSHRPSGGRRRRELGRPPWLSSACCTSPCRAQGGVPSRWRGELGWPQWPRAPGHSCEPPASGRATASPVTGAVCEATMWVDLPWIKRIPVAHTTVPWPRGSPAAPHRRRRG
jgi:hypothetical protein